MGGQWTEPAPARGSREYRFCFSCMEAEFMQEDGCGKRGPEGRIHHEGTETTKGKGGPHDKE